MWDPSLVKQRHAEIGQKEVGQVVCLHLDIAAVLSRLQKTRQCNITRFYVACRTNMPENGPNLTTRDSILLLLLLLLLMIMTKIMNDTV